MEVRYCTLQVVCVAYDKITGSLSHTSTTATTTNAEGKIKFIFSEQVNDIIMYLLLLSAGRAGL